MSRAGAGKFGRFIVKGLKSLVLGVLIVLFSTIGIDAFDKRDDMSESVFGRIFFGENEGLCPEGMVVVEAADGDFCIDKYEVSAGKDCPFNSPSSAVQTRDNLDFQECLPVSKKDTRPWTYISQNQAARACAKVGKRLPNNKEWYLAALGTPDIKSDWSRDDCQVAGNWNNQPGLSGSGVKCFSYAGAYDMIGNVWEWVDGAVEDGRFEDRELPSDGFVFGINENDGFPSDTANTPADDYYGDYFWLKSGDTRAIARGGYWDNKNMAGQYSHYIVAQPSSTEVGIGFRCVKNIDD